MIFNENCDPKKFDEYVSSHPQKSHFMQSTAWGEFSRVQKGMRPFYTVLENDDGTIAAAALLLLRAPVGFPPYLYCPRGFVIDFTDSELVDEMTAAVKTFARKCGAMFVKIDPDVERRSIDENGEASGEFDNEYIIDNLKSLGWRHHGYNLGFEGSQPRFTFRIDLNCTDDELTRRFVGNVMKNIRKGEKYYRADVVEGGIDDIPELFRLIGKTSERDEFFAYPLEYYKNFYDILSRNGMASLYLGKVYPASILNDLKSELTDLRKKMETMKKPNRIAEAKLTEARLEREIPAFEKYAAGYPEPYTVSAHLVVHYGGHSWAVHAGSDNAMSETFINNRVYCGKILSEKHKGSVWLDQFGTIGDPVNGKLRSLHEFKRQFGGRYIEFIGEFDLVINPLFYWLYETLLPKYRRLRLSLRGLARKLGNKA